MLAQLLPDKFLITSVIIVLTAELDPVQHFLQKGIPG